MHSFIYLGLGIVTFKIFFFIPLFLQENMKVLLRLACFIVVLMSSLEAGKLRISLCFCLMRKICYLAYRNTFPNRVLLLTCVCGLLGIEPSGHRTAMLHSLSHLCFLFSHLRIGKLRPSEVKNLRSCSSFQSKSLNPNLQYLVRASCHFVADGRVQYGKSWHCLGGSDKCSLYEPTAKSHQEIKGLFLVFSIHFLSSSLLLKMPLHPYFVTDTSFWGCSDE